MMIQGFHRGLCASLAGLLLLAACGTDRTGTSGMATIRDVIASRPTPSGDQPAGAAAVTPEMLARIDQPLMVVAIPDIETQAVLYVVTTNNGVATWKASNNATILMDGPVLFATRGIGPDLLTAETRGLRQMLEAGRTGQYRRELRYLDGLDQITVVPLDCALSAEGAETLTIVNRAQPTRHMQEICLRPDGKRLRNEYWLGSDGTLWQSRQWVGDTLGYMATQRLVR
jgi:hypothetical protein